MLTISGLARAEACPSSEALPQFDEGDSPASEHGVAVHEYLRRVSDGLTVQQALECVDEKHHEACLAIDLSLVPHSQVGAWTAEVAYALNTETLTARALQVENREYPALEPGEIPGTADLVGLDADGETVTVLDVKTGRRWLGRPEKHLQLVAYAVAAALAHGRSRARVGWLFVREGEETPRLVMGELDEFALAEGAHRVRDVVQAVQWVKDTEAVEPHLGEHCRYCPAYRSCPAHKALVAPFLSNDLDVAGAAVGGTMMTIKAEDIPRALERTRAVIDLAERVKKELEDAVRACGGVDLPDGRRLAEVRVERESIDADKAEQALLSVFGSPGVQAIEVKKTVTKAAIERLARARAAETGERIKAITDIALSTLRSAGAITTSGYTAVKVVKAAPSLAAPKE
jgi:CRISPR/Cas system-associated exonuclease Cas4 (RecB family)